MLHQMSFERMERPRPDSNRCPRLDRAVAWATGRRGLTTDSTLGEMLSSHPVEVGQRTEAIILAELVKRGYRVLLPFGVNHRYDMVIHNEDGTFTRVQCKTGCLRNGAISFQARSVQSNTKAAKTRRYDGEADIFLVYCPDTDKVYRLEVAESGVSPMLRVHSPKNGQSARVRWAADYELTGPPRESNPRS